MWNVPKIFRHCSKVMVTTWGHDPHFIPIENLLTIINDTLRESPVLIQVLFFFFLKIVYQIFKIK